MIVKQEGYPFLFAFLTLYLSSYIYRRTLQLATTFLFSSFFFLQFCIFFVVRFQYRLYLYHGFIIISFAIFEPALEKARVVR